MYFLYVVHFTLFVGAIHWSVGKLLSKHPRISLIVLSMPVSGRTLSLEVNGVRILLKAQYFNSFYLPSSFSAAVMSWCLENRVSSWMIWLTDDLVTKTQSINNGNNISFVQMQRFHQFPANFTVNIESVCHVERIRWWRKETHTSFHSHWGFTLVSLLCFSFTLVSH